MAQAKKLSRIARAILVLLVVAVGASVSILINYVQLPGFLGTLIRALLEMVRNVASILLILQILGIQLVSPVRPSEDDRKQSS